MYKETLPIAKAPQVNGETPSEVLDLIKWIS